MLKNINIEDDKERSIYFHDMADGSRSLELLLHTCYNNGIVPYLASVGHSKNKVAYIILNVDHAHLNTIGRLIDLTLEVPDSEFNIKSSKGKIYAELGEIAIADYYAAEYNAAIGESAIARRQLTKALKQPLRSDIKLRAEDLKVKLTQDIKKNSLF